MLPVTDLAFETDSYKYLCLFGENISSSGASALQIIQLDIITPVLAAPGMNMSILMTDLTNHLTIVITAGVHNAVRNIQFG